jgi:glyoxylase-like metal-dependent hydrolase (beta-lactamase superfamily II)
LRDALAFFLDLEGTYEKMMTLVLRKFAPLRLSRGTMRFFETLPGQELLIGGTSWTGWVLGDDAVWVLEDRGHSPDHVFFYIPEHRFLHTGDTTYDMFTIWPDSSGEAIRAAVAKCAAMARAGEVGVLADGHHHRVYRGREEILAFLEGLLEDDRRFREVLVEVVGRHPGLTIPEIYRRLEWTRHEPVVQKYLDLEFPHAPGSLQALTLLTLLDMGCVGRGPRRRKRFYLPQDARAEHPAERGVSPR